MYSSGPTRAAVVFCCLHVLALGGPTVRIAQAKQQPENTRTDPSSFRLQAKPDTCVALHKGQVCFQKIRLTWNSPDGERLCLFISEADQPLHCSTRPQVSYQHAYQSNTSQHFYLRQGETGALMAEVSVTTVWVYRTGRRSSSSWRLF